MISADVISRLEAAGWRWVRTKGSHQTFKHPNVAEIVTVPHPRKDIGKGLVRKIERISGVKMTED